ncbi:non-specific lipid-transfer protein C6 [Brachypodium distachyon]|uniref:Bifunctional inhibitor/plant lipid transfer protein/seed storage helical domain-containing protein n=1 Tax=Brachypodium distachyon TaxID=15368 RepID=I1IKV1_BRADI|nr:non-specific lipid-transfer protein C6 [Brachypodium distachyon]PNT63405.1 hypothetical protein BRADI_4g15260v3 [Brachypodium distachyon]|eukprot:XP_014757803.1 non-specific lipid-transfer protein C6 [Brachypodium distachyon]
MASSKATCTAALLLLLAAAAIATPAEASKKTAYWDSVPGGQKMRAAADQDAASTCVGSLLALSPCLSFFRDAGTSSAPEGCCEGLRGIVDADQAVCLCHIVNRTLQRAIGVDIPVDRAFDLISGVCGIALAPPQDFADTCTSNRAAVPPLYACPAPSA